MTFQRARKPEEKEVRRRAILVAARDLAREVGPINLGLNELGRRSGVSKTNIYRYFESREDILLRLFITELDDIVSHLEKRLGTRQLKRAKVAALIVGGYLKRPLLCRLLGIVASILEHNLSADASAVQFAAPGSAASRVASSGNSGRKNSGNSGRFLEGEPATRTGVVEGKESALDLREPDGANARSRRGK